MQEIRINFQIFHNNHKKGGMTVALKDKILSYRKEHLMTQREFASRCGVDTNTISRLETGKHSASKLTEAKIEQAMNKPITKE